jgi:uncharacterized repeat protein (TIGR01451 family)
LVFAKKTFFLSCPLKNKLMKHNLLNTLKRIAATAIVILLVINSVQAQKKDLVSELKAFKAEMVNGKEKLTEADKVSPGDIIEYQLTYKNETGNEIKNLKPVLPIPFGTELVENTALPIIVDASVTNETSFKGYPIMKDVTLPNGSKTKIKAAAKEYRYIRWTVDSMKNNETKLFKVRVKVVEVKQ